MNPVRAGIVKKGTDSPWTSFGQSNRNGSFGRQCHMSLLRVLARLAGAEGTDSIELDSIELGFAEAMAEAEAVSREAVRAKIAKRESLSLSEMLVCRVHAFSNGRMLGSREALESVPMPGKRITPVPMCGENLCTATRLRGTPLVVA